MPVWVGSGGAWKSAPRFGVGASGVYKLVLNVWVGAGGAWKHAFAALSVSVPNNTNNPRPPGAATSLTSTANVTGGIGPFSYQWSYVSGHSFTIDSPTAIATTFSTVIGPGQFQTGTYRCTVTDHGTGAQATTTFVVSFQGADN